MKDQLISFSDLYQRYAGDVYRFAFWMCGDSDVAQDIVSETFTKVWFSKKDIRLKTVKAFLFTIARNEFLKGLRKKQRRDTLPVEIVDNRLNPGNALVQKESVQRTYRYLKQLPEPDRTVLILHAIEQLPQQEIAIMLKLTLSTVKVKIFRARRKLLALSLKEE